MSEGVSALDSKIPFKPLGMVDPAIEIERRSDGTILMWSCHVPAETPRSIPHIFHERAREFPDRAFIKERKGPAGEWQRLTYAEALRLSDNIAQALIDRGLGAGDAALILSGNSTEQALLILGCMTAGVSAVPVSAAYSLASSDFARLLHCAAAVRPAIVFAQEAAPFARAIAALRTAHPDLDVVTVDGGEGITNLASLSDGEAGRDVDARREGLGPDTVAKILFTSGSTGMPKGVPQTQRMMTAVLAGTEGLRAPDRAMDEGELLELLDWMPWSHISAGNINFNGVISAGGTLYLDGGRPVPGLFDQTIRNLYDVSPIHFASAPIAFGMLADALESDAVLRRSFFRKLRYLAYGGATLSDDLFDRLQALSIAETGERIPIITMYGSTETQGITMTHWATERVGMIGLPLPGMTLKLVPNGAKLEVRVKGPTVMPGYLGDPEKTAAAFDEEGFYCLGDAVRFLDEAAPEQGLVFDGRVAEDFKLDSGTWVSVGTLRPDIVAACSPMVQDAVIAGQDKRFVAAILWPSAVALAQYSKHGVLDVAALGVELAERLAAHNRGAGGSSRRVHRIVIASEPLSVEHGEITDKGYVNQRAVIDRRADSIARLYDQPPADGIIEIHC
ncbi:AMP-binding protein [Sphingopyxis sp.]|uniref:AMP-binding protein n=1 Tax=Sphingopyxis sp. TaxID=1908224 RepID=UPI002ED830CC